MTKSLADNCAKIIPALGVVAVAELRLIRRGVVDYIEKNPRREDIALRGFLVSTVVWLAVVANLVYYQMRCLVWLSVNDNMDRDPRLAHSMLWVVGVTIGLLATPPAVINMRQAVSGRVKKEPF